MVTLGKTVSGSMLHWAARLICFFSSVVTISYDNFGCLIYKKSPQIVGLGPPMCSQIFWPVNVNANQLNILVHLQQLWFHNAYQFKAKSCSICYRLSVISRAVFRSPILGVRGALAGWDLHQLAHSRLANTWNTRFCSIWRRLATIHNAADRRQDRQSDRNRLPML